MIYINTSIRRDLRALGYREFPMPSNTAGIAKTCRKFFVDVVKTMPLQKKNSKRLRKKQFFLVLNMFLTKIFFFFFFWSLLP